MAKTKDVEKTTKTVRGEQLEVTLHGNAMIVGRKGSNKIKPSYINGKSLKKELI